jgi:AcrR family transcriptional regulator
MTLEHDAVREKLVEIALDLLSKDGLDAVKARTLSQAAGVSVGSIYNLFGTIDGLIAAACLTVYQSLGETGKGSLKAIEEAVDRRVAEGEIADTVQDRTRERLIGLAQVYIDFVIQNAGTWNAVLAFNRLRGSSANARAYAEQLESLVDIVGRLLETVPRFAADASLRRKAGRALWSAVHGIVVTNALRADDAGAKTRATELIRILVGGFVDGVFVSDDTVK